MLYSLQSSLWAGKPIEVAFTEVVKDLRVLYPDPENYIILGEFQYSRKIEMNETVENAISDFEREPALMIFRTLLKYCRFAREPRQSCRSS